MENKEQAIQGHLIHLIALCFLAAGLLLPACTDSGPSAFYSPEELGQFRRNFQVTENIIAELKLIHQQTQTRPRPIRIEITQRQPRHVWHKARLIDLSIQNLKYRNGLDAKPYPYINPKKIVPTDVYNLLSQILKDIRSLRAAYGVTRDAKPAPPPKTALPQDVYMNLERVNQMILGIDNRAISPRDLYLITFDIVSRLRQIRSHEGITVPIAAISPSSHKHPRDVYKKSLLFHSKLKRLAEKRGYFLAGGVVLLNQKKTRIIPSDVMDVLTNITADVEAMSASMNLPRTKASPLPEKISPSKAFDKINEGIAVVETML